MRTFSRDDIAVSKIEFQPSIRAGINVVDSSGSNYEIIDQFGTWNWAKGTTELDVNELKRQKGLVYVNFNCFGFYPTNRHVIIGKVPEGFRPKTRVYIVGGIGEHGITQVYIDPNGDVDLWFNGNNMNSFRINNRYNDGEITGQMWNPSNITYTDPRDGSTNTILTFTAFRSCISYFVQD